MAGSPSVHPARSGDLAGISGGGPGHDDATTPHYPAESGAFGGRALLASECG